MLIPILFYRNNEKERCPNCGCEEDKKTVCNKCGHVYEEENPGCLFIMVFAVILLILIWFAATILDWLFGFNDYSLVEVLEHQWRWLKHLRVY